MALHLGINFGTDSGIHFSCIVYLAPYNNALDCALVTKSLKKVIASSMSIIFTDALNSSLALCPITDPLCVIHEGSDFKKEWGECITGELTQEEQVWSDRIVKAWTNFAIHG